MAKHTMSGKPNKNLLMHIRKNPGNSVKESGKYKEANTMPGYTDDSQHHLKYIHEFIAQCENLEQRFADLRNDQTEIVKKLDMLESRRRTVLVSCKSRHNKQISAFEETPSASSTLDHTSNKRDSDFTERLQMLRRTRTSLANDNRIINLKNTENVLNIRSFVYFSNVQHFRMILSASQQHGDCVAFQDVSMGTTSEYDKSLVIQSASPKRKLQMRQLRRFNTDTKEDNRIVSYEAQIEHVRDKKSSQNRTQAKELRRQDDRFTTELHENKTEMKTEISSTEKPVTRLQADKSKILMPKSNTVAAEYSRKGVSFEESEASTASMLGAVQSQLKSRLKEALGDQFDESLVQFNTMQIDEEQMKNMKKQDGTMDLLPALRTHLQTMLTDHPELSEHIDISEALVSNGNDLPFLNMSTLMRSQELESAYHAELQEGRKYRVSGHSVETIICLDTSESMKGPLWTKAITFAKNFILEVKHHPCRDPNVFERIGLVTFGHVTRVQAHLTRHYDDVLSKLDTLSPSGPRPLMPGLKMCEVAFMGAGIKFANGIHIQYKYLAKINPNVIFPGSGRLQMNKMSILPRIILITDGKTTSHNYQEGLDFSFNQDLDEAFVMHTVQEIVKSCPLHIDCVSLGESKIDFLAKISQSTNGKIYKCEEWKKLGRRTKFLDVASRNYKDFLKKGDNDFIRSIIRTLWSVKGEDLAVVEESMRRSKASEKESSEEDQLSEERIKRLEDQLLPIGTRVRRGPDWEWGDQDSQGAGTIVGYDKNNWVSVIWDNYDSRGRNSNMYRYAVGGNFDVMPVEEPRVLSPGEIIAVGCKVKRGRDWIHGDQDGGSDNVGTVIKKGERSEKVTVRWPNRKSYKYKFGKKGKQEIQLCDTHESYTPSIITVKESDTHESYTSSIMTEKERESVVGKCLKEIEHQKVKQKGKEIDVEEMNRRNIEMSKRFITSPDSSVIEN